jgi:hypothetical protein
MGCFSYIIPEFHPRALPEPDVNLSVHPAPSIQPCRMEKLPVRKEPRVGPDDTGEPLTRGFRLMCQWASKSDLGLECAPAGGQDQAAVLTVGRAC